MSNPKHLPPEALNTWLAAAADELGLDASAINIATVLDVARDVAHDVARPAAPLTTFLLGVAVGQAQAQQAAGDEREAGRQALAAQAKKVTELAAAWKAERAGG